MHNHTLFLQAIRKAHHTYLVISLCGKTCIVMWSSSLIVDCLLYDLPLCIFTDELNSDSSALCCWFGDTKGMTTFLKLSVTVPSQLWLLRHFAIFVFTVFL